MDSNKNYVKVDYNFYKEYIISNTFQEKLSERKKHIRSLYNFKDDDDKLIQEYFVEIFSWTVIPLNILEEINSILSLYDKSILKEKKHTIFDPCSGNSFHTFLFNEFCKRDVITVDIQPERNSWIHTYEKDGLNFLKGLKDHSNLVLLLSWIDYDELTYKLTKNFRGNIIISIGNYENISLKYLKELHKNFKKIKSWDFKMPWFHEERVKIYIRKNII